MPTSYVKKMANSHDTSVPVVEKKWNRAKKLTKSELKHQNWAYTTEIFKKLMGESVFSLMDKSLTDFFGDKREGTELEVFETHLEEIERKITEQFDLTNDESIHVVTSYTEEQFVVESIVGSFKNYLKETSEHSISADVAAKVYHRDYVKTKNKKYRQYKRKKRYTSVDK